MFFEKVFYIHKHVFTIKLVIRIFSYRVGEYICANVSLCMYLRMRLIQAKRFVRLLKNSPSHQRFDLNGVYLLLLLLVCKSVFAYSKASYHYQNLNKNVLLNDH